MILSPKTYNVYDQYDVYMNILLTTPPPLGVAVVVVDTIVAIEVDGTKVDCVTDKVKDIRVIFFVTLNTLSYIYIVHVAYNLHVTSMYTLHIIYMFPITHHTNGGYVSAKIHNVYHWYDV